MRGDLPPAAEVETLRYLHSAALGARLAQRPMAQHRGGHSVTVGDVCLFGKSIVDEDDEEKMPLLGEMLVLYIYIYIVLYSFIFTCYTEII